MASVAKYDAVTLSSRLARTMHASLLPWLPAPSEMQRPSSDMRQSSHPESTVQ